MNSLFPPVHACLMQTDPESKLQQAHALWQLWQQGQLDCNPDGQPPPEAIPVPGRPRRPELVHPRQVRQRKLTTAAGRIALLHAVAHIEFNAINLALDAAYRFRGLPPDYYGNWLQVAAEEARHFRLVRQRLQALGADYGDLPAHNGLWEQACKTDHDPLVRMALVPRVLEARGLDVTPGMMERLRVVGDVDSVQVLAVILQDEIGHVRIGSHWFRYLCRQRGLEPESTFRRLLLEVMQAPVRGPFYTAGRLQAGFSSGELEQLLLLERRWQAEIQT